MEATFESQRATALRWRESTAGERIVRIRRLREAMLARREAFHEAFRRDFAKPPAEVEGTELLPVMDEMRHAIAHLRGWMRPQRARGAVTMLGTAAWIQFQPRGRVLVIAPWNYPLSLSFGPLVTALAAGNTVILKPSEMAPAVSAVMKQVVGEAFPASEVALFEGGPEVSQRLLELPFDHIFFTGSTRVGRIVMAAAARHLASVTLELGGKTPTIVTRHADLRRAAEAIVWGKFMNAGQTCVAPDYVYAHQAVKDAFMAECRAALDRLYGAEAQRKANADLARIINEPHARRLAALLDDARARGAAVTGGEVDLAQRYVAPTLLDGVAPEAHVMQEEIFGPLLPVLAFSSLDAVIGEINARPKPLALYVFSESRDEARQVLARTSSGGACVNHCVLQFAHGGLPFGGVNESGLGNAHGFFGFRAFSHERAVLRSTWPALSKLFFPPFTARRYRIIRGVVDFLKLPMP
ncbi:MAG TPA: aldehyde dehydrogenase family protein [Usitatibacter sp.]|nr:aldehyde dehydrogenase family protein [Usitatibacter sp.]